MWVIENAKISNGTLELELEYGRERIICRRCDVKGVQLLQQVN
jgi:hypothetical protein